MQTNYAYTPDGNDDSPVVIWGGDPIMFTKDKYRAINIGGSLARFYLNIYKWGGLDFDLIYKSKEIVLQANEFWDYSEIIKSVLSSLAVGVVYDFEEYPIFKNEEWENVNLKIDINGGNVEGEPIYVEKIIIGEPPVFFLQNRFYVENAVSPWPLDIVDVYGGFKLWYGNYNFVGIKNNNKWECQTADSRNAVEFYCGLETTNLAFGSCDYEPEIGEYFFDPIGRVANVEITGNVAQNLNCDYTPPTKKQMCQIRYLSSDGFTIQRFAEVVEFTDSLEQTECKETKRKLYEFIDYGEIISVGVFNYSQVLKSNQQIKIKWKGLPIAEQQRILAGMINSPFVILFVNENVFAGILIAEEKTITEGDELELSFAITNYKII